MGPWLRIFCAALALAALSLPLLALRRHGWTALETHGDGTEMVLWMLLFLGGSTCVPAAVVAWAIRRQGMLPWLALLSAKALVVGAQLYIDAYLDACMLRAETTSNPAFLAPSSW
jgi:hypothetical protein